MTDAAKPKTYVRRFHVRPAPDGSDAAMITIPATGHSLREHRVLDGDDVRALATELLPFVPLHELVEALRGCDGVEVRVENPYV